MSHIVQIQTEVRDPVAIAAACDRLRLKVPRQGTAKLYSESATGWLVELPGWRYPIVCDTTSGEVRFDNFQGHWGEPARLNAFQQAYAIEKARIEARKGGHTVYEQPLPDGSVKVIIQMGGAV